jgi:hypothetical protein
MDATELQHVLREQLPTLTEPTAPPPEAYARVRWAVARRRRRVRKTIGISVAGVIAFVVLVPLAVIGLAGSDDTGDPIDSNVGSWHPIAPSPLSQRDGSASVWTGQEMIVVGGNVQPPCPPNADCVGPSQTQLRGDGAAYNPATDSWRSIAPAPAPFAYAQATWSGREMVVIDTREMWPGEPGATLAYNPETDAWRELDAPPADYLYGGVWDGHELVYWASEERADSADWSLEPWSGKWTKLPPDPFDPTYDRAYVWTGERLIFLGVDKLAQYGASDPDATFHLAEYNPATRTWTRLPDSPVLHGDPMWFVHQGRVVNPYEDPRFETGQPTNGVYNPKTGTWSEAPHSGAYTYDGCTLGPLGSAGDWLAPGGGVLYSLDPADTAIVPDCPQLPEPAAAVWAGDEVIIWGGPDSAFKAQTNLGLTWTPPPAGDD